jgi:uncharacterized protein (UPF0147 family)
MSNLEMVLATIDEIVEDRTVPKNIRETLKNVKECIDSKEDKEIAKDKAIQLLDNVNSDPNMPVYTRTQIWNIISMLEGS